MDRNELEERVCQALERVRPYLHSHGGNVERLGINKEGLVRLRLEGSYFSCPSSRVTLKYAVESLCLLCSLETLTGS